MGRVRLRPGAASKLANREATKLVKATLRATTRQAKSNAPGGSYSTGVLKASIFWELTETTLDGVGGRSGSTLVYANSVHGGQPAREITPKQARRLRFFWRRTGRVETFRRVNHPGTRAQPFLTDALKVEAPKRGFKVVIF